MSMSVSWCGRSTIARGRRPSPAAEFPLIARRGDRRPTRAVKGVYRVSADVFGSWWPDAG
jgi:hypothetical protein